MVWEVNGLEFGDRISILMRDVGLEFQAWICFDIASLPLKQMTKYPSQASEPRRFRFEKNRRYKN